MMFVVVRHVRSRCGRPSRFTVKISSRRSRTLAAASGQVALRATEAYWSSLRMPSLASSFQSRQRRVSPCLVVLRVRQVADDIPQLVVATALYLVERRRTPGRSRCVAPSLHRRRTADVGRGGSRELRDPRAGLRSSRSRSQRHRCARSSTYFFPSSSTPYGRQNMVVPELDPVEVDNQTRRPC